MLESVDAVIDLGLQGLNSSWKLFARVNCFRLRFPLLDPGANADEREFSIVDFASWRMLQILRRVSLKTTDISVGTTLGRFQQSSSRIRYAFLNDRRCHSRHRIAWDFHESSKFAS